ncbi:hypothetical protein FHS23_001999 [Prauserella isguenensis]|uniref:Uncharacterized protein n=1 Tax=Prauserella isguenensis TaxID=1470180 RepID=A0A839RZS6_9PSEU|nr:hypothetical protein [Prauserella isguenensis]
MSATPSREELQALRTPVPQHCGWCGRAVEQPAAAGRRRRYCGRSCRQRAYERRTAVQRTGLPDDAVVLSGDEVAALQDRLFQLRCAAEDVATAAVDGAGSDELQKLAGEVSRIASDIEALR